jgi:hypothetical protein
MRKLLFGAVALVLLGACSNNVEIKGDLKGLTDTKAVLSKLEENGPVAVDTVDVKGGKFAFEMAKSDAQLYLVAFDSKKEQPIAFFGGDGNVTFTGSVDDMSKIVKEGSKSTEIYEKFNKEIPNIERSKSLYGDYMKAQMANDTVAMKAIRAEAQNIQQEQNVYVTKFIESNTDNAVGEFLLLNAAGGLEPVKIKELAAKFEKSLPKHAYTAILKKMLEEIEKMEKMQAEQMKAMGIAPQEAAPQEAAPAN